MRTRATAQACQTLLDLGKCACQTRCMNYDMYDEDLPEIDNTWADLRNGVIVFTKVVSIPTGLFVLTCIANYFINKKVESL